MRILITNYDMGVDDEKTWANPFSPYWLYHFDTPRGYIRNVLCDVIRENDLAKFSKALHSLQDTYSHAGYTWPLGHIGSVLGDRLLGNGILYDPDKYDPINSLRDRAMRDETSRYLKLWYKKNIAME